MLIGGAVTTTPWTFAVQFSRFRPFAFCGGMDQRSIRIPSGAAIPLASPCRFPQPSCEYATHWETFKAEWGLYQPDLSDE